MKKIVYGVGLTGGHIYPALAMAEVIAGAAEHLFVARCHSPLADRLIRRRGYSLLELEVSGMPRGLIRLAWQGGTFLYQQIRSWAVCRRALADWKPDLAVGFGGYVCVPLISAAKSLGIKTMLFEPNAKFGLANKILAPWTDVAAVSMGNEGGSGNCTAVAPPLRPDLLEAKGLSREEARRRLGLGSKGPCLLVFGGSQGASVINDAAAKAIASLRAGGLEFCFIHVAGFRDFAVMQSFYQDQGLLGAGGRCLEYLEDMGSAYQSADLVVSRAGAMSCLELMEFGRRCLLIPLAASTEGHQLANAHYLEELGIARILKEDTGLPDRLEEALRDILNSAPASSAAVKPQARQRLEQLALALMKS